MQVILRREPARKRMDCVCPGCMSVLRVTRDDAWPAYRSGQIWLAFTCPVCSARFDLPADQFGLD